MTVEITRLDYNDKSQVEVWLQLLDNYAQDPMGGGDALGEYAKSNLQEKMATFPGAFSVLARVDGMPAGFSNCFTGFSTFNCQPLINIHDIAVNAEFRGAGVAKALIDEITVIAKERGCCKVTLEVLQGNKPAMSAYRKSGFTEAGLDPQFGGYEFWQKNLD